MKTIFTIALLMTSTIIFGATLNIEFNSSNSANTINYMETLAIKSEMPSIVVMERISTEVLTDSESTTKSKDDKKTTDKKESSKSPNQDYQILKRSQRILEVKYKLYA